MFTYLYPRPAGRARLAARTRKRPPPFRPCLDPLEDRSLMSANAVLEWNQLTLEAIGQTRTNPLLGSRAVAITQLAVYDAVNAIDGGRAPYAFNGQAPPGASPEAAVAVAAYTTLVELFPTRQAVFDAALASSLAAIPDGPAENQGAAVGRAAAHTILALRRHDGSDEVVPYTAGTEPGDWQPTPPLFLPALGPHWTDVTPFAMTVGSQFRPPPPPELDSEEYAAAFDEVRRLGGNGTTTPTERDEEQTEIARFWSGGIGTSFAFGHWNLIAQVVSTNEALDLADEAHLFAVLNLAMTDAGIACWDAKYEYNFWRPVTAIRAAAEDGSPDETWTPLLTTPNFPSYTSAHSTVSGSAAAVLTSLFGPGYEFSVGSESLPGVTRSFDNFDEAAAEAGQSRVYGGIHFQFDCTVANEVGVNLGNYVLENLLLPRDDADDLRASAPVNESLRVAPVQPLRAEALPRADGVIGLDDNAAGWGRFVAAMFREDSEFTTAGDQGGEGRMDLLPVMREVGPLSASDDEANRVLRETPTAGLRRTVTPIHEPDGDGLDTAHTGLGAEEAMPWIIANVFGRGSKRR